MSHPASGWAEQDPAEWQRGLAIGGRRRCSSGPASPVVTSPSWAGLPGRRRGAASTALTAAARRHHLARSAGHGRGAGAGRPGRQVASCSTRTGLNADASHTAPKIMWLRDNEPETYRRATAAGRRLSSRLADRSDAQDHANASSTLLYDVRRAPGLRELLAGPESTRSCCREITRSHRDRRQPAHRAPPSGSGFATTAGSWSAPATSTAPRWAPAPCAPGTITDVTGTAEPVTAVADELVARRRAARRDARPRRRRGAAGREPRLRLRRQHHVARRRPSSASRRESCSRSAALVPGRVGRRAVPADAEWGDGAALERPRARRASRACR